MKRNIEFQTTPTSAPTNIAAGTKPAFSTYKDDTYAPEFKGMQVKFQDKLTWLRFVPAIKGSQYPWMMKFKRFHDSEGRFPTFVDPETFGLPSVFSHARMWFQKNKKEELYRKENPRGFRFYPQERGLSWVINANAGEGSRLRLLNASLYDGTRGGTSGLGSQIWTMANEIDNEPGSDTNGQSIHGDVSDPATGKLIGIEKSVPQSGQDQFASYSVRIGKQVSPLNMGILTDDEMEKITPLEKVLHVPSEEEQKAYLRAYIGEERYAMIFP